MRRGAVLDAVSLAVSHAAAARVRLLQVLDNVAHGASEWPYVSRPRLTLGYVASMGPGWRALALRSLQRKRLNSQP